jgi:arylsulfatase A-like enzyme
LIPVRILIVDIDSLRPDHLGCYGYGRDTSPAIDAIADAGVHFEECYASDTPCLPSRTALATCRFGEKRHPDVIETAMTTDDVPIADTRSGEPMRGTIPLG